jgi:Lysozyme like domain
VAAKLSDVQIATVAKAAGFPGNELATAVAVALAESRGDPTATHHNTNGSTDYGLWQINSVHSDILATHRWQDPAANAVMARFIFTEAGSKWSPWSTYKHGSYLAYLPRGRSAAAGTVPGGVDPGNPDNDLPPAPLETNGIDIMGIGGLVKFAEFISSAHNWQRLAIFLLGLALAGLAVARLTGADKAIGAVANVVPVGRVLNVVKKVAS